MDEIDDLIKESLDELRKYSEFRMPILPQISTLKKIGLDYGLERLQKVLRNKELASTAMSGGEGLMLPIPNWVHDFIDSLSENSDTFLDPWIHRNSYLLSVPGKEFRGFCMNRSEKELLVEAFGIDKSRLSEGEPLELIQREEEKVDLVISFPPFGKRAQSPESLSKSYSVDLLIESSKLIKEDGKLIFLVSPNFSFNDRIGQAIDEAGLFVEALFHLPEGSHSPTTKLSSYLAVISKAPKQKTFVAKLSVNKLNNVAVANNFNQLKEGKTVSLGRFVELDNFSSYGQYEKIIDVVNLGRKTGLSPISLNQVATFKTIKAKAIEDIRDSNRNIYLPRIGYSDVVENPIDFTLKPHNYIQLTLGEDVFPAYLVKYFNTSLGKLTRESIEVGATIRNITLTSLQKASLYIPAYQEQIRLIEVNNKIENLLLEISDHQKQLWKSPKRTQEINKSISHYEKDTSIEKWLDSLPFPISSILWKYVATSENVRKVDYLLHFFEAFSEFLSMLLLSSFYQNKEFYESESYRWIDKDVKYDNWIRKATFGGWNILTSNLLKTFRTLYKDESKDHLFEVLGRPNNDFLTLLGSKKIIPILESVREYRNDWKGHGGVSSEQDNINRLILLEQELNNLRQLIQGAFDDCRIVSPSTAKYNKGVFNFKAKELVGNKTPFNEIAVNSLVPLDENKLYLIHQNNDSPIELLPFIKFNQTSKACYFYNSVQTTKVRWVSFHFEQNSEFSEVIDERFEEVLSILKRKSDS